MLIACWSTKGGVGTSVVAAALALLLGRTPTAAAVLADLAGDAPAVLGLPEPASPGLAGWLSAGDRVPADALGPHRDRGRPRPGAAARGDGPLSPGRGGVLAALLDAPPARRWPTAAGRRPRRGRRGRPAPLVRCSSPGRATSPCDACSRRRCGPRGRARHRARPGAVQARDVEAAADAPVVAEIPLDPQVARLVDAGSPRPVACPARSTLCAAAPSCRPLDARVHQRVLRAEPDQPLDDDALADLVRSEAPLLDAADVTGVVARVRARIGGLGPIEPLLADPGVSDVLVNGPGPGLGRTARLPRAHRRPRRRAAIDLLVERVIGPLGLRADRATPVVDARLPDGSRGCTWCCRRWRSTGPR